MVEMSIICIGIIASKFTLGLIATGGKRLSQRARSDRPGKAPAVLAPTALTSALSGKVAAWKRAASCASLSNQRQIVFFGFMFVCSFSSAAMES